MAADWLSRLGKPGRKPGERENPPGVARVRAQTLVLSRWLAVAGQFLAVIIVHDFMQASLPLNWVLATIAASALLNIIIQLRTGLHGWHSELEAASYLCFDILQLSFLLFLTGGLSNPFVFLLLAPVTISATILSNRSTYLLGALAALCTTFLSFYHLPLPWPGGHFFAPTLYLKGVWMALVLCVAFLIFYISRVAGEARHMSDALAATQLSLAREQELSSLGALAAAAAHELGTPLGTIALIAREVEREIDGNPVLSDDMAILRQQVDRCRDILTRLSTNRLDADAPDFQSLKVTVLATAAMEPYRREGVEVVVTGNSLDEATPEPRLPRSAELLQGLGNFMENAMDFASASVQVCAEWDADRVMIEILDDGPGFSEAVYSSLGDPYISTRRHQGGMGLGVFISKTLLERTGAVVSFANRRKIPGARVRIVWRRSDVETPENY